MNFIITHLIHVGYEKNTRFSKIILLLGLCTHRNRPLYLVELLIFQKGKNTNTEERTIEEVL